MSERRVLRRQPVALIGRKVVRACLRLPVGVDGELRDFLLGLIEDASAALDQGLALFVAGERVFEADLAGLDLLDKVLELIDGLFEAKGLLVT